MADYYDGREILSPEAREVALLAALRAGLPAATRARAWAARLAGIDPAEIRTRADLARIPVLRKPELAEAQKSDPPFGGFAVTGAGAMGRLFMSPGPVFEPEDRADDSWGMARALHAAGFRPGDIVLNCFGYTLTPGGFIFDSGARALGCAVIPGGPGNTEAQIDLIAHYAASGFTGTPDFLKVILDAAAKADRQLPSLRRALVSGGALFPSLRAEYTTRGIDVRQAYATADLGVIAYESEAAEGLIVNEDIIVEIVRPGSDEPVADGEVGEVVVTRLSPHYPLIRFGTGDLSAILPGLSPCGRTAPRIKGWMGRADQRTKVKGMFVDPAQIDAVLKRHPEIRRARLVVSRAGEQDAMTLRIETDAAGIAAAVASTLREITKLKGDVEIAPPASLPNDGKVIADDRNYG
ncbi:MAG: AMP-binding protein [Hyphomicrobiaceae bacterium]|nr:AMP-binding protein [Hyphomicrobiaceae bacterium]